jgi:photosystem II stability/assembly factor-like uncharacterized protein
MRHTLILFVLGLTACFAPSAVGQPWVQSTGPVNVKCLAATGDTIFAGAQTGLYLSPDNGQTWTSDGFDSSSLEALAIFEGKVFAGTSNAGLFVSTDKGLTWTPDTTGFNGTLNINSLAVSAPNLVAATSTGLFVSTDRGISWAQSLQVPYPSSLMADGSNVYAIDIAEQDFCASSDRGMHWTIVKPLPGYIYSLAALDGDIFAALGTGGGVVRSTNTGVSWEPAESGAFDSLVGMPEFNCHYLLTYGQNLFMASDYGIFLTTDTGAYWTNETDTFQTQPGTGQFYVNTVLPWNGNLWAGTLDSLWLCPLSKLIGLSSIRESPASSESLTVYPNPFTDKTTITISPSESGVAEISMVNLLGEEVTRIYDGELSTDECTFTWEPNGLSAGMYECIVRMNGTSQELPLLLER